MTKNPRRRRNSLSQQVILDAALRVTDARGIGSLTFEALGRELGAHPTAIYRYFSDKDELIRALTDALHAEGQGEGLRATDDWRADLRTAAYSIHDAFLAHPQVGQLVAARTAAREHEFALVDYVADCLLRAGLRGAEAARCYRVFCDFVLSYSSMDAALAALAPEVREVDLRPWAAEYRHLPAERYPAAASISEHFPALDDPDNFALAVELMVAAIGARVAASVP